MDTTARIQVKKISGIPTVAPSADHRNGDWTDADIYPGEIAQDTTTGKLYTRNDNNEIITPDGLPPSYIHKVLISQSSTSAPTTSIIADTFGGAWSYVGVGHYRYTSVGKFVTGSKIFYQLQFNLAATASSQLINASDDTVDLKTYNSAGVLTNGLLVGASLTIEALIV